MITFNIVEEEEELESLLCIGHHPIVHKGMSQNLCVIMRLMQTLCRHQWLLDYFDPIYAKPESVPSRCCNIYAFKKRYTNNQHNNIIQCLLEKLVVFYFIHICLKYSLCVFVIFLHFGLNPLLSLTKIPVPQRVGP